MTRRVFFSVIITLALCISWHAPVLAQTRIMIGSTGTASSHYAYWVAVGEAIKKYAKGVSPTVVETGGALDNADRLIKGQIDLGLTNVAAAYQVYHGEEKWEGKPQTGMRWLWIYTVNPMDIVVREDSGIKSIYDLTGKKFCAGARGSGGEKLMEAVFRILDIKPDYYRGGYSDAAEAVENRQIVGLAKWSASEEIGDALITQLTTTQKMRSISIDDNTMKKIVQAFPYVFVSHHPPNVYKGQDYEVEAIGTATGGITNTSASAELIYTICKAVWEGKEIQEEAYHAFKHIDPFKLGVKYAPIPLHAGVVKFCKERGIEVPAKLIPPEYKD